MNPIDVHVGMTLRNKRRALYLGMDEVAHAMGLDFDALQRLEAGAARATAEQIRMLCRLYAMAPADIYRRRSPSAVEDGVDRGPPESVC